MSTHTVKKKGFRAIGFNEHWTEDPPGTFTSTNDKAQCDIEWGKDDGQHHGDSCEGAEKPMKPGSKVVITEGGAIGDDRAVITRVL